jgi:hypothetical protein
VAGVYLDMSTAHVLPYNARMTRVMTRTARMAATMALAVVLAGSATVVSGCGASEPEVGTAIEVTDVVTGWFDAGIVNGQNKLVPTISFRLKNRADRPISGVDLNSVFRVIGDEEQLGSKYVKGIDRRGLAPGGAAGPFVLRSELGYTSEAPRTQMLQNSQFKDAQVQVYAKHGSQQWVRLAEYTIQRQLLTQ